MLQKCGSNSSHRLWLKEDSVISPSSVETFSKKGIFFIKTKYMIKWLLLDSLRFLKKVQVKSFSAFCSTFQTLYVGFNVDKQLIKHVLKTDRGFSCPFIHGILYCPAKRKFSGMDLTQIS